MEQEVYKELIKKRWGFTKVILVGLSILALFAYAYLTNLLPVQAWWFIPLLGVVGLILKFSYSGFNTYLDSVSSVFCPKCSKLIEKQQIIGNPKPKECSHCGLRISRI